jgi:hypothetical protein
MDNHHTNHHHDNQPPDSTNHRRREGEQEARGKALDPVDRRHWSDLAAAVEQHRPDPRPTPIPAPPDLDAASPKLHAPEPHVAESPWPSPQPNARGPPLADGADRKDVPPNVEPVAENQACHREPSPPPSVARNPRARTETSAWTPRVGAPSPPTSRLEPDACENEPIAARSAA